MLTLYLTDNTPPGEIARAAAAGVVALCAVFHQREKVLGNRLAYRARRANGRFEVHEQARARVHFDNGAPLGVQGLADVLRHHVDAGNVQAHHPRCQSCGSGYAGMQFVGDVAASAAM